MQCAKTSHGRYLHSFSSNLHFPKKLTFMMSNFIPEIRKMILFFLFSLWYKRTSISVQNSSKHYNCLSFLTRYSFSSITINIFNEFKVKRSWNTNYVWDHKEQWEMTKTEIDISKWKKNMTKKLTWNLTITSSVTIVTMT